MSFDLRIQFSGLMVWVPEGHTSMHVLLPATGSHVHAQPRGGVHGHEACAGPEHDSGVCRHFARLVYDAAYERPGQTQLSREYVMVDLADRVLDLTGVSSPEGIDVTLPDEIPSLDTMAMPVERVLVDEMPDARLAARVSMRSGSLTSYELGAPFNFVSPDVPQRITAGTEWTIRGIDSRTSTPAGGVPYLPGQAILGPGKALATRLPDLYPIRQTIEMTVFHVVPGELPPHAPRFNPAGEGRDDHFSAYFQVARPRDVAVRVPVANAGMRVRVKGDLVDNNAAQIPGVICVQAQASLQE